MKTRVPFSLFVLSLVFLPVQARTDKEKSAYEQDLERLESEHTQWDTRARETAFPEEKEQFQTLASQYRKLISLRKEVESSFGSKKIPLQKRLEKMRAETRRMQREINLKYPPPNPFPDNPFIKPEAEAGAEVKVEAPPPLPPARYKTESGFEVRLRLVD